MIGTKDILGVDVDVKALLHGYPPSPHREAGAPFDDKAGTVITPSTRR